MGFPGRSAGKPIGRKGPSLLQYERVAQAVTPCFSGSMRATGYERANVSGSFCRRPRLGCIHILRPRLPNTDHRNTGLVLPGGWSARLIHDGGRAAPSAGIKARCETTPWGAVWDADPRA
jgi:hypothetical protein